MGMSDQDIPIFSWRGVRREFTRYLPAWFLYASAIGLLHELLANFPDEGFAALGIPRTAFVPTVLFPLAWVALFFGLRIRRSTRLRHPWRAWLALAAMVVAVPLAVIYLHRPYRLTCAQLALWFEISQFVWVALLAIQVLITRGRHGLVLFFGVTFAYGVLLENCGIVMGYFFEPDFHVYLRPLPAPLCTMVGWCLIFYVTVAIVGQLAGWVPWLARGVGCRALAATLLALCVDAQLDPLASMSGVFWRWNELLPPAFLGVPAINYAAWLGAFLPFAWFVFSFLDRADLPPGRRNWEIFLRVPLASVLGAALCFAVMAIVEGGFDGATFRILGLFVQRLVPY